MMDKLKTLEEKKRAAYEKRKAEAQAAFEAAVDRYADEDGDANVEMFESSSYFFVVRRPSASESGLMRDVKRDLARGKRKAADAEDVLESTFLACLLYPSREELERVLSKLPMAQSVLDAKFLELCGLSNEAFEKK